MSEEQIKNDGNNESNERTEEEIIEEEKDLFEEILKTMGIDLELLAPLLEKIRTSSQQNNGEEFMQAVHSLLGFVGDSTEKTRPEMQKFRKEIFASLKPFIDEIVKASLLEAIVYIEEARADAGEQTLNAHERMQATEAALIADMIDALVATDKISRAEALEIVKIKVGRTQNISLSFPTTKVSSNASGNRTKSKEEVINDFMKLTQENPEEMLNLLFSPKGNLTGLDPRSMMS